MKALEEAKQEAINEIVKGFWVPKEYLGKQEYEFPFLCRLADINTP
ncbi:MAG: hypothetical protein GY714_32300 [Desulfobacterales bacterium]|nr:hypothetical protein [Desulfobacterales bacterium]